MVWNQPPKIVTPQCSSNMRFFKPSHDNNPDLPVQSVSRSAFDPRAVKHWGEVDRDKVNILISHVRKSMPCTGLQHLVDSPTNPDDVTFWSDVLFSLGAFNSTVCKHIIDQFLESMRLSHDQVSAATREQADNEF